MGRILLSFPCFVAFRGFSMPFNTPFFNTNDKFSKPLEAVAAPVRIVASSLSKEGLESIR